MSSNTVYLVTGANRGIGKGLTALLLLRPSTTVIATVRDPQHETAQSLLSLPTATGSVLVILTLNSEDAQNSYDTLTARLRDQTSGGPTGPITALDAVIANAGTSDGFRTVLETTAEEARFAFEANTVGPLELFKTCWPLLKAADERKGRKFVLIGSSVASIAGLETESFPVAAYGMSKAAANWLVKKISVEFKEERLSAGVVHPGWVKTAMGQSLADAISVKEPPTTVEESAEKVLEQIDNLSLETQGRFVAYNGQELPW